MREQRFPSRGLTALGLVSFGLAILAAGCGGGGSSGSSAVTPNLTSPTPGAVCASGGGGVAYIPLPASASSRGILMQPFETNTGQFITTCQRNPLTTQDVVTALSISTEGDGAALVAGGTKVIGLNGFLNGNVPYVTPFSSTVTAGGFPLSSIALLPLGTLGIAVDEEPHPGPTSTAGFIGVNNLLNFQPSPVPFASPTTTPTVSPSATPTAYNPPIVNPAEVPYTSIGVAASAAPSSSPSTALAISSNSVFGRPTIALGPDGQTILVRGDQDLTAFAVETSAAGFFLLYPAAGNSVPITSQTQIALGQNTGLGYGSSFAPAPSGSAAPAFARGLIAFDPTSAARALIGDSTSAINTVSLVNQIPNNLTVASSVTAPGTITSVAVAPGGNVGAIGTASGLEIVTGVGGGTLNPVTQTTLGGTINYTPAGGTSQVLGKVVSVAFSTDGAYLLVIAANSDGTTASLLAFRVDANGILSSPTSASGPAVLGSSFPLPSGDTLVVH